MKSRFTAQRGSVVLVALCLTLVLGVAVAGYVAVCARTMEMSNRSFYYTSSVQLAEIGLEEALWSLNNSSWSGWHTSGAPPAGTAIKSDVYGNALPFTTNQGIPPCSVNITVSNYNTSDPFNTPPTITATGISQMPDGIQIQKQLQVIVKPAALFSNAVGSTAPPNAPTNAPYLLPDSDFVYFKSGGTVDSYDSALNTDPNDPIQSANHKTDQAIISGPHISTDNVNISGYAAFANSYSYPPYSPSVDPSRISNNANQYAFDIVTPTGAGSTLFEGAVTGTTSIGTSGATTPSIYYDGPNGIALAGGDTLTIDGPVIIVVTHDFSISGSAKIAVTKGADPAHDGSAQIYVAGNLDIEGGVGGINLYVADSANDTIRKITPTVTGGVTTWGVTTPIGTAGIVGSADGTGSDAQFNIPKAVAVYGAGTAYVADTNSNTIRKVTPTVTNGIPTWVVATLAGSAGILGSTDGTGSAAQFSSPAGVAVDGSGNVYVADTGNDTIRKITSAGVVSTLAGSAGVMGSTDGTGSAAQFNSPSGIVVDDAGNIYVADTGNHTIRKITPVGGVSTLAGSPGSTGSADGTGNAAQFYSPSGVAVDNAGNVYVADSANDTIRKITQTITNGVTTWVVTTLAGSPGSTGSADGTGAAAQFNTPKAVAVDGAGNVYVADTSNDTIRKITPTVTNGVTTWVVTTLVGSPGSTGSADGTGGAARFNSPTGLAVDLGSFKNLTKRPRNLAIFCNGSTQSTINTTTPFYGAVYAPNSPLVANVDLTVYGALVGQSVTFTGTPAIHYDLDLRKATFSVVNTPYDVSQWLVSN